MKKALLYLIRDGDVTGVGVTFAIIMGLLIISASLYFFNSQTLRILGASIGLVFVSFGGYAARSATLGLKPFDNSYKKAKASYSETEKENKRKTGEVETKK